MNVTRAWRFGASGVVLAMLTVGLIHCSDETETPAGTADAGTKVDSGSNTDSGSQPQQDSGSNTDSGPTESGRQAYAVDSANGLVKFKTGSPGIATKTTITGLGNGETVLGIDYRPKTGELYALGSASKIYKINPDTAVATAIPGDPINGVNTFDWTIDPNATSTGFDFNPAADRIRIHTNTGKNYRLHPDNGKSVVQNGDTDLLYTADQTTPKVGATAYTNSVSPAPAVTVLFAIDTDKNQLVKVTNPNGGITEAVGALGVDPSDVGGFDIFGGEPDGGAASATEAYALLTVGGTPTLYTINLTTGAATAVGALGVAGPIQGMAVKP